MTELLEALKLRKEDLEAKKALLIETSDDVAIEEEVAAYRAKITAEYAAHKDKLINDINIKVDIINEMILEEEAKEEAAKAEAVEATEEVAGDPENEANN